MLKTNFHTHSTWCDGRNTPEEMILAAIEKGFGTLGFSSHMAFPFDDGCAMLPERSAEYVKEIRELARRYAGQLQVRCGGEADYIPGATDPARERYAFLKLDYLIGSIHQVVADDGGLVPVDHTPELLAEGVARHFGGDMRNYVETYFRQLRDMVTKFDFDVIGHPDLVRKFNLKHPGFDESSAWYRRELEETAEAIAASGKLVEVNTGAISRGWLDDAYPSPGFRALLRARGVKFILSSDAHAASALDCAFDRFAAAEDFVVPNF